MRKFAETMLIAALGGALFDLGGFPAGWMAGALVFVAVLALIGRPMHVPVLATRIFFIVLGVIVGGVATPETVRGMSTWPASIVLISVGMLAVTAAGTMYLRTVHRWDLQTSMFASVPGALSQVSATAAERNSDLRAIVIVQTLRVVMLAVGVPGGLALLGLASPARLPEGTLSAFEAPLQFARSVWRQRCGRPRAVCREVFRRIFLWPDGGVGASCMAAAWCRSTSRP